MSHVTIAAMLWALLLPAHLSVEGPNQKNPLAGDPEALEGGRSLYRWYCSPCHGLGAEGGIRGPNLVRTNLMNSTTEQEMFQVIKQGIMGTEMPPHPVPDNQIWQIITFLDDRRSREDTRSLDGDAKTGEMIYFGKAFCSNCHMINGQGGRLGPDLTRIGTMRSINDLIESIRKPSSNFRNRTIMGLNRPWDGYSPVTLLTKAGRRITGAIRNEDTFTIQVIDVGENHHSVEKSQLKKIIRPTRSLMPPYPQSFLSDKEMEDLLTYLIQKSTGKSDN